MGEEETAEQEDPRRFYNSRVGGWYLEVVPTDRCACRGCGKKIGRGNLRLVVQLKGGRFMRRAAYCPLCAQDILEKWEVEISRVAAVIRKGEGPVCFLCEELPPMKWRLERVFTVPRLNTYRDLTRKLPKGWLCPNGHLHKNYSMVVWPPRKVKVI